MEKLFPSDVTINQLFKEQLEKTPDHIALISPHHSLYITYRELNRQVEAVALFLQKKGIISHELIGLSMSRSPRLIISILGILKAGCAYVPLNPHAPIDRNKYILEECAIRFLITDDSKEKISSFDSICHIVEFDTIENDDTDPGMKGPNYTLREPEPSDIAYVIFTSGSTGKPKGVPISHSNLSPLLHWGYRNLGINEKDCTLHNLSYYFDWSVWEIFITLTTGASLMVVPDDTLLNAEKCIDLIEVHHVTVLHVTPSQYRYYTLIGKRLETLRYLFIGAEKFPVDLLEQSIASVDTKCRIFNMYGPTEATIISATLEVDPSKLDFYKRLSSIPIGYAVGNTQLIILNDDGLQCPPNEWGELYIGGDCISRGYLNNPQLTAERFIFSNKELARTITDSNIIKANNFYKTGDRCRVLEDGSIEFQERIDHQVKLRGFRIELGEIQNCLLTHPKIHEAVVLLRENKSGEPYLCAYIIGTGKGEDLPDSNELKVFLKDSLPQYMIPSFFIPIEQIPLNPNGKIDRNALPEPQLKKERRTDVSLNPVEKKLIQIWADVLNIDEDLIHPDDNFFDVGGDSLKATMMLSRIKNEFGKEISMKDVFINPFIKELSVLFDKERNIQHVFKLELVDEKKFYPMSTMQKGIYVLTQIGGKSTVFNIPDVRFIEGNFNIERIKESFLCLIRRHESLRTSFGIIDGEHVQIIHDNVEFYLEDLGIAEEDKLNTCIMNFIRPFDLEVPPLLRAGILKLTNGKYLLLTDIHHSVSDGTSQEVLFHELKRSYDGYRLPPVIFRYKDFSNWQKKTLENNIETQEKYWLEKFKGEIPIIELPLDFNRPRVQSFEGKYLVFYLDKEKTDFLKQLASKENATLYMVLIGIFQYAISIWCNREEMILGIPLAGRRHPEIEQLIGMFIQTLPLRFRIDRNLDFRNLLNNVKKDILDTFENQDYPLEMLLEKLKWNRDPSRNPLYDIIFVLQNMVHYPDVSQEDAILYKEKLTLIPYFFRNSVARSDIALTVSEKENGLEFVLEYCTKLFKESTIYRIIHYYNKIVDKVLSNPEIRLKDIDIFIEEDKKEILNMLYAKEREFPINKTIHGLFREQVERTPDHIALISPGENPNQISYRVLDEQSFRLARYLHSLQLHDNELIGIMMHRSLELVIGMLGILKTGSAYVPLNPSAPVERNKFILADCGIRYLITNLTGPDIDELKKVCHVIFVDHSEQFIKDEHSISAETKLPDRYDSTNIAYVIYTSGSTGHPKGVPISHSNFCQLVHWGYKNLGLGEDDKTLHNLSYYFDWSVWEIFLTITSGAALVVVPDYFLLDTIACIDLINRLGISVLHVTPSQYGYYVSAGKFLGSLRYLCIGAEKFSTELLERSLTTINSQCRIFNMYGPTEATIISAILEINRSNPETYKGISSIPIGKAVGNIDLIILDQKMNPCPINIWGELYIGGDCLSQGYLNNPELTIDRFIPFTHELHETIRTSTNTVTDTLYKTGDLCRWLEDPANPGNLIIEFLERIDHQVKIRGFRIELGEIESKILAHPDIQEAIVLDRDNNTGEKYLCAYIVGKNGKDGIPSASELKSYLSDLLPGYMIPTFFVPIDNIPLNPNGKIDRKALPVPDFSSHTNREIVLIDSIEDQIASIWSELLGIDKSLISREDNFLDLGGHSLKATRMAARIHQEFNFRLTMEVFFEDPTLEAVSKLIRKDAGKDHYVSIEASEEKEYYPLSPGQARFYFIQTINPSSTVYNIFDGYIFKGKLDIQRLEYTLQKLIQRHDSLRTSFVVQDRNIVQKIASHIDYKLDFSVADNTLDIGNEIDKSVIPFDLSNAPLLKMRVVKLEEEKFLVIFNMHHIIGDLVSMQIFVNELMMIYNEEEEKLPPMFLQYKDYSEWWHRLVKSGDISKQEQYWLKEFSKEIIPLKLPYDFERPLVQSYEGQTFNFEINASDVEKLRKMVALKETTMYVMMLTLFYILLSKISGQNDVTIGTPVVGRDHSELYNILGVFINTLALRNTVPGDKSFFQFLAEIRRKTLEAFDNQEYPFDYLVKKVWNEREKVRNPIYDVLYTYQKATLDLGENIGNSGENRMSLSNFNLFSREQATIMLDLIFVVGESDDSKTLNVYIGFCTKLFKPKTIEGFKDIFNNILRSIIENPNIILDEIKIAHELKTAEAEIPQISFGF